MTTDERRAWYCALGRNIRAVRRGLGLRQWEIGLSKTRVCRIERGQVEIDASEFSRLRTAMGAAINLRRHALMATAIEIPARSS